ncbi:hypothetical protein CDAR_4621 [Caerostris darwini]|uniref:Uncharacterized protein n=1 Tax=Caerostris darwini TaxID=1538125 RepID=A0AAV4P3T9_9ARAC|nr:hypothetical protein CDAR_4621 [Caerostris darwini]
MVRAKLPPDEARRRRLESARRSRQKPEVKQNICEDERKQRLEKRMEKVAAKDSNRATKLESLFNVLPKEQIQEIGIQRERQREEATQQSDPKPHTGICTMDVVKQCEEILEKNILQYLHSNLTCFEKKKSKRLGFRESGDYATGLVHPIHIQGNVEVVLHAMITMHELHVFLHRIILICPPILR